MENDSKITHAAFYDVDGNLLIHKSSETQLTGESDHRNEHAGMHYTHADSDNALNTEVENDPQRSTSCDGGNGLASSDSVETPQAQSVLDESVLDVLRSLATSSQSNLFVEIINTYLESSPALVEQLVEPDGKNDIEQIAYASHTLKSSSANVGAIELSQMCGKIEAMARSESMVCYNDILNSLKTMYPLVCEELSTLVKLD